MNKVIVFNKTGNADVLQTVEKEIVFPKENEVQIQVKALGINRAEIMYRTGKYVIEPTFPAQLGYEAAGIVSAVGSNVSEFNIGDKVSIIPSFMFNEYGMYGELVNAPVHSVVKHPENLTFEEAAASWMMYITAYGALVEYGQLKQGQNVLITAASSSVAVAAIQICNMLGANPIVTTRSQKKRDVLLELGAKAVIVTDEQDIEIEVTKLTNGYGVDIVFDPIGGPNVAKISHIMAPHAIFFQYGALDNRDLTIPVMDILAKHLIFRGYELFEITMDVVKRNRAKEFIYSSLASGQLKPPIARIFPFEEIVEAHQYMESNDQIGKIVVRVN